jgi:hypothetical protein
MEKAFSGLQKPFNKPKNDFPWGINKRGREKNGGLMPDRLTGQEETHLCRQ